MSGRHRNRDRTPYSYLPDQHNAVALEILGSLENDLKNTGQIGTPFHSGNLSDLPNVRPRNVEMSSSPVDWEEKEYLEKVKPLLKQAPYGKGTETVIDKEVRNALEIGKDDLEIDQLQSWSNLLNKAVLESAQALAPALNPNDVVAELYKLVVYEEGGHFKPHRDTQRGDTHFGTLVVLLPGKAKGGELVLRHGDREETFTIPAGKKKCTYVAYFADVEHEVKPVTKGRRISLLYNLHRKKDAPPVKFPVATSGSSSVSVLPPTIVHAKNLSKIARKALGLNEEPPTKKIKLSASSSKGKEKEGEEEEEEEDNGKDEDVDSSLVSSFIGLICEHSYAGELSGEKLKGRDASFFNLFAPHFPGTRVAQVELRLYGPGNGDDAKWIKKPSDLIACVVEVDEVNPKQKVSSPSGYGRRFAKSNFTSRSLFAGTFGNGSDYDLDQASNIRVRFLNDDGNLNITGARIKVAEKNVEGSGNEGSSGAFLYKQAAILVPLYEGAEDVLDPFSDKHTNRSYPSFLP